MFRKILFWCHLVAGVTAGVVILVMCVTGTVLAFEKQLVAWADTRHYVEDGAGAPRLPVTTLVARVQAAHPDAAPTGVTVPADPSRPVAVALGQRTVYVGATTGRVWGEGDGQALRRFLRTMTNWHRWLAVGGDGRATARAITGWSNVLFAFIVLSGMYLWLPRVWTRVQVRQVAWFRGGLRGKARDFNWHHVIGIWSAVPLFVVVVTAFPISFPWASRAIYVAVGEAPPAPPAQAPRAPEGGPDRGVRPPALDGLDAAFSRAQQQVADWRTIGVRLSADAAAPLTFTIDRGYAGQPHLRGTLTVPRDGTAPARWEPFEAQSLGRRLRSISRFAHTGEVLGLPGQAIAGLVTAGGTVLVWTGIALTLRRFRAWRSRRDRQDDVRAEAA
jgi:uncharacterized iron-regulated membrane protein